MFSILVIEFTKHLAYINGMKQYYAFWFRAIKKTYACLSIKWTKSADRTKSAALKSIYEINELIEDEEKRTFYLNWSNEKSMRVKNSSIESFRRQQHKWSTICFLISDICDGIKTYFINLNCSAVSVENGFCMKSTEEWLMCWSTLFLCSFLRMQIQNHWK